MFPDPIPTQTACPSLGNISDGRIIVSGHLDSDMAVAVCDANKVVVNGSYLRFCDNNGVWNGTEAQCGGMSEEYLNSLSVVNIYT